jgi:branched-chain amino acid transport system permease protein
MDAIVQNGVIGILLGGIYGLVSMGLTLIFGVTRVVNFAQGELVMVGMYATYLVNSWLGWNPYLTLVIVVPVLFVLGLVIQRLVIQPLSDVPSMQLLATFGLVILLQSLALIVTKGTVYTLRDELASHAFDLGPVRVDAGRIIILVVTTAVAIGLRLLLRDTTFGRSVRAVTQDRRAARLMGINVERTFLVTFGIGAGLAGLAGVLLTPVYSITPNVGQNFIFAAFAVVVVGGLGNVTGAYIGGFLIGLVDALTGYYLDPTLSSAFYFAVFLWVLVVKPAGLFGQAGTEKLGETV